MSARKQASGCPSLKEQPLSRLIIACCSLAAIADYPVTNTYTGTDDRRTYSETKPAPEMGLQVVYLDFSTHMLAFS